MYTYICSNYSVIALNKLCIHTCSNYSLSRGVTIAWRWLTGKQPWTSDALHISVKNGRSSGRNSLRICVGSRSRAHDLVADANITFWISSAEYDSNLSSTVEAGGRLDSGGTLSVLRRTTATFSLKYVSSASAVDWFEVDLLVVFYPRRVAIECHSFRGCFDCSLNWRFQ